MRQISIIPLLLSLLFLNSVSAKGFDDIFNPICNGFKLLGGLKNENITIKSTK